MKLKIKRNIYYVALAVFITLLVFYKFSTVGLMKAEGSIVNDKKILIAYYSYSGNTKVLADKIKKATGGDMVEIIPEKPYPSKYDEVVELAKIEKVNNIRPVIKPIEKKPKNYDIVFVGTPVWWYTMASPVKTFLTNNNFDGKVIVPFCTHGGGGESSTYTDMQKLVPKADIKVGYTSYERTATDTDVANWIKSLNL